MIRLVKKIIFEENYILKCSYFHAAHSTRGMNSAHQLSARKAHEIQCVNLLLAGHLRKQ